MAHDNLSMDKTVLSVVPFDAPDDQVDYWLTRTPGERFQALEILRRTLYGYSPTTSRLQRVLEIAEREPR